MDLSKLSDSERLVAEQAVLTLRALNEAADKAEHGKGMAALESVIHDKGMTVRDVHSGCYAAARLHR